VRVIGIDPGGTTGTALFMSANLKWFRNQLEGDHHRELWAILEKVKPHVIVCESWLNLGKEAANVVAPQYVGIARLYAELSPSTKWVTQTPSEGKGFWNDQKLKKVGLYMPGKRHANDATRHVLHYLVVSQLIPEVYLRALKAPRTSLALQEPRSPEV
jgi:hypothetical protein